MLSLRPVATAFAFAGMATAISAQSLHRIEELRARLTGLQQTREQAGAQAEILAAPSGGSLQDLYPPPPSGAPSAPDEAERAGLAVMIQGAPTAAPKKPEPPASKASPQPKAKPTTPSYRPEYLEMLRLVNEARAVARTCGTKAMPAAGPVALDPHLVRAAEGHSKDMATRGYFSHTSQDGRSPWKRIKEAGFPGFGSGENIYSGPSTHGPVASAADAVRAWLKSPGHCSNLMSKGAKLMGVGTEKGPKSYSQYKWTQVFAGAY